MNATLTFKTRRIRVIHVNYAENFSNGGTISARVVRNNLSAKTIHKMILAQENEERTKPEASFHRSIALFYWVTDEEVMIDNRSKFGHSNQTTRKILSTFIEKTYVRGEIITIGELLERQAKNELNPWLIGRLNYLIEIRFGFDQKKLTNKQRLQKVILIPGEGAMDTTCEEIPEGGLRAFTPEELLPIKNKAIA